MKITVKCAECEATTEMDITDIFECGACGDDTVDTITAVEDNEFGLTADNIDEAVAYADDYETNIYLAYVYATGAHYDRVEDAKDRHLTSGDIDEYLFETFIELNGIEINENYLDRDYIVNEMRYDYYRGTDLYEIEHVFDAN